MPHYDLTPGKRRAALSAGAFEKSVREFLAERRRAENRRRAEEAGPSGATAAITGSVAHCAPADELFGTALMSEMRIRFSPKG